MQQQQQQHRTSQQQQQQSNANEKQEEVKQQQNNDESTQQDEQRHHQEAASEVESNLEGGQLPQQQSSKEANFFTVWNELSKVGPVPKASAGVYFKVKENGELSYRFENHRLTHKLVLPHPTSPEFDKALEMYLPALPKPAPEPSPTAEGDLNSQDRLNSRQSIVDKSAAVTSKPTTAQQPTASSTFKPSIPENNAALSSLSINKPLTPSDQQQQQHSQTVRPSTSSSVSAAMPTNDLDATQGNEKNSDELGTKNFPISNLGIPSKRAASLIESKVRVSEAIQQGALLSERTNTHTNTAPPKGASAAISKLDAAKHRESFSYEQFKDLEDVIIPPKTLSSTQIMTRTHLEKFPNIYSDEKGAESINPSPVGLAFNNGKKSIRKMFKDTDIFFFIQEDRPTAELMHKFRLLTPTTPDHAATSEGNTPGTVSSKKAGIGSLPHTPGVEKHPGTSSSSKKLTSSRATSISTQNAASRGTTPFNATAKNEAQSSEEVANVESEDQQQQHGEEEEQQQLQQQDTEVADGAEGNSDPEILSQEEETSPPATHDEEEADITVASNEQVDVPVQAEAEAEGQLQNQDSNENIPGKEVTI